MIWVLCEIENRTCIGVVIGTIQTINAKCHIAVMHIYANEPQVEVYKILLKRIKLLVSEEFTDSIVPFLQQQRNYTKLTINHIEKFSTIVLPLTKEAKISQSIIAKIEVKKFTENQQNPPKNRSHTSSSELQSTVIRIPKSKLPQTYRQLFGVPPAAKRPPTVFNIVSELSSKKISNKKQLKNHVKLYIRNLNKIDLDKLRTNCRKSHFTVANQKIIHTLQQQLKKKISKEEKKEKHHEQQYEVPDCVEIKKSAKHGNGVFAKSDISSGVTIDFVRGKIVDKDADCDPIYALSVAKGTLLMENWTRFINGCSKENSANVHFISTLVNGEEHAAVNSIKSIKKDSELLVYYGENYTRFFDIV